jgi:guanosine-3',5'-bis(diphosphate) 3'-pyrophosphohydrolase
VTHALILRAADFAARQHRDQRRKGVRRWPYINHPLRVACLLVEVGDVDDPEILAAALLHDTVEDTGTLPEELARCFGERVRDLVLEVSDDKGLSWSERKRAQIEHAPRLSGAAVLIKLADKTANIRDIIDSPPEGWSVERRQRYLEWAQAVIEGCAPANEALEQLFDDTLAEARRALDAECAT